MMALWVERSMMAQMHFRGMHAQGGGGGTTFTPLPPLLELFILTSTGGYFLHFVFPPLPF